MSMTFIRGSAIGTVSALALAVAGQAHAVSFDAGATKVTISGYIKGDLIFDASEDLGDTFASRSINTGAAEDTEVEGHFGAHARQTRLHIATSTPTENGNVTTMIQGDFFGAEGGTPSSSNGFRLRHAWAEWNGIGFGQTWSNFMPLVALPPTLDFAGPSGYVFNRQAQARYTMKTHTGALSVALEDSEARLSGTTDGNEYLPDISIRYAGNASGVKYSASGVVNFLEIDDGAGADDTATGYAVMLAASTKTDGGTTIGGNIGHFDGANRYLWQGGGGGFTNAFVDAGKIETAGELAVMAFVDQALSDKTNAMLAIGYSKLDDDAAVLAFNASNGTDPDAAEEFTSVHVNIRHSPVKSITFGAELIYGKKEMFDGTDGDAARLQVSGQYAF